MEREYRCMDKKPPSSLKLGGLTLSLFSKPHTAQQIILANVLVIQRRSDVQHDQRDQNI
jgi:hypothetical protein